MANKLVNIDAEEANDNPHQEIWNLKAEGLHIGGNNPIVGDQ